jgi:hypothetical protein
MTPPGPLAVPAPPRTLAPAGPSEGRNQGKVIDLLLPGSFVRLIDHPEDLPPFQLIGCRGGRCWVRQQAWGCLVHWEVAHRQLKAVV